MEEEEIIQGAQVIGLALRVTALLVVAALVAGIFWAWRRWA
jgi:hypothetical protein